MNRYRWADICRGTGLREVKRENWPAGVILVGDGHFPHGHWSSPHGQESVFMTMWAFGRQEDSLEVARPVWTPTYVTMGGLAIPVTAEERLELALDDAHEWMRDRHAGDRAAAN